jgi:hypothetical protein
MSANKQDSQVRNSSQIQRTPLCSSLIHFHALNLFVVAVDRICGAISAQPSVSKFASAVSFSRSLCHTSGIPRGSFIYKSHK